MHHIDVIILSLAWIWGKVLDIYVMDIYVMFLTDQWMGPCIVCRSFAQNAWTLYLQLCCWDAWKMMFSANKIK